MIFLLMYHLVLFLLLHPLCVTIRESITGSLARVAKKKHKEDVNAANMMVEEVVGRIR